MNVNGARDVFPALFLLLAACLLCGCDDTPTATPAPRTPGPHRVETVSVAAETTGMEHVRTGTLESERIVHVHSQEEGTVVELPWLEGDRVASGALLVRLDDRLLRAELDKARAERKRAEEDLTRLKGLVDRNFVTAEVLAKARATFDVARAEEERLAVRVGQTRITAPFDGMISERLVEPGDAVAMHTHLLTLVDPAALRVRIGISELLLPALRVGDVATVRIDALGTNATPAHIERIHPVVDPVTRHGTLDLRLDAIPAGARAGQLARITLTTPATARLLIPFAALQRDRDREYVFHVGGDGKAFSATVRSGARIGDRVEILDGLEPGQEIVLRGLLGLRDGMSVEIVGRGGDRGS